MCCRSRKREWLEFATQLQQVNKGGLAGFSVFSPGSSLFTTDHRLREVMVRDGSRCVAIVLLDMVETG